MPTKEELIKFISENEFNEEIIGQLFGILTKEKEEPKDAEEQPDLPEDKKEEKKELSPEEKRAKVEEIFGKF